MRNSLMLAVILFVVTGCKPYSDNGSILADAATTSSYKTGFFKPKTKGEYQLVGKGNPTSVSEFMSRVKQALGSKEVKLALNDNVAYATTVNGSGETMLLLLSDVDVPLPVLSLKGGKVYEWHQKVDAANKAMIYYELFIKAPYGKGVGNYIPDQMYVRRSAINDSGAKEPVIVPWTQHVKSEVDRIITFRMGNTIMDARTGVPILEFEQIENKPAWILLGSYSDGEVKAGSVFWRSSKKQYYSITPESKTVVKWTVQDGDSLDRVGKAQRSDVKVPKQVLGALKRAKSSGFNKKRLTSFDSYNGDSNVFQLDRNSMVFQSSRSDSSFGLAKQSIDEDFSDEDYVASEGFNLGLFSSNKPVKTHDAGDGSGNKAVSYTDQNGTKHGGILLSSRRVHQPGGMFSSESYEERHYVANRTNNTVSEVRADGTVVKKGIPYDQFKSRVRTQQNMRQMQREGGSDGRAIRESTQLAQRSKRQLARSESLLGGNSVGEMTGGIAEKAAVAQVKTQLTHEQTPLTAAGISTIPNTYQQVRAGKSSGDTYENVSQKLLYDSAKGLAKEGVKPYQKPLARDAEQLIYQNGGSATNAKQFGSVVGAAPGIAIDTGKSYYDRTAKGDFNRSSPDYFFDSSVSSAAVAGTAVKGASQAVVTTGMQGRTKAAASTAVGSTVGTLFDSTEAVSRASYSQTLERERSNILESPLQQHRDVSAGNKAIGVIDNFGY